MRSEHPRGEIPPVPGWFVEEMAALYVCFPSAGKMPATAPVAWWRHLHAFPEAATRRAFARAPRALEQPHWLPSAELVRRIAEAETKTLSVPRADLSRPALPEPEPELDPSNPFHATLERYKRGEIPGRRAVAEMINSIG